MRVSNLYFLNEDHTYRPCEFAEWITQCKIIVHVADDTINDCRVSTVWLGTNASYDDGPPLLFETMIFKPDGSDTYCLRYTTWDQAIAGHKEAIDWVKNGCKENE